jgi:hypothetical protein
MVWTSGSQSGLYRPPGALRGKGALEVGPSEDGVCLFTIEVTLDQTLVEPIHRIKNLLTVKQLLNVVR